MPPSPAWRRAAVRAARVGPEDDVLDVACGNAALLPWLDGHDSYLGVDTSEDEIARALVDTGAGEVLENCLEAVFRNHTAHPAQLVWACEAMTREGCPEPVARRMTASVLEILPRGQSRIEAEESIGILHHEGP